MKKPLRSIYIMLITLFLVTACAPAGVTKLDAKLVSSATPIPTTKPMPASPTTIPSPIPTMTPSSTEVIKEHEIWKFQTGAAIWGSPLYSSDTVYIGSDDGKLYAVSAGDGTQKWAFATHGIVRSQPVIDTAQGSGILYFSSDDGYLYALNAEDGTQLWRTDIGNFTDPSIRITLNGTSSSAGYDYRQSSPVLSDGHIYIGSADGKVYAVSANTGKVLWTYQTGAQIRATPTLADGILYVGSWDYSMYALDAQTGALRWQTEIGGEIQTTALVSDNLVYSASRKASVVAIDTKTGKLQWEHSYGQNMWVESSPTLVESTLYVGSSGTEMLFGFDAKTGEKHLGYIAGAFCWSRPLVVDQTLFMGCTNFNNSNQGLFVLAIGPNPAKDTKLKLTPLWQLPTADSLNSNKDWSGVASSAIFAKGVIFFGGLDGALYAVRK